MPPLITLTTDLGEQEPFAASIKGALLSLCPGVNLVDLSHQVSPHDVTEAALFVLGAVPHFPAGTVHLINVAPGPQPVIAKAGDQVLVCPDNGILTLLEEHFPIDEALALPVPESVSCGNAQTFFGREVLAPAAAAIASGKSLAEVAEVGGETVELQRLDWPKPQQAGSRKIEGRIMHIDRFGNLITNIHRNLLESAAIERIAVNNISIRSLSCSYSDVEPGHPIAVFGHSGYLEVAYNGEKASERLGIETGILISVFLEK
ncbi:MAG: SAM-dependent chlorinase/fluorinase [Verrucomicrobiales bacterium]|nr:SAM-dependent chlorinase/fluorinase [Verrucomicrobiales bacterium]